MKLVRFIRISNFQSHKKTVVSFGPGLNIIKGRSHSGKSAFMRALRWCFQNRPRGDSFRYWGASKKEFPAVVVGVAGVEDSSVQKITRFRKRGANGYSVNGERFVAVKQDVPENVTRITRMEAVNIQGQHDRYFLLQETPGKVAVELNKLVGLDIVEQVHRRTIARVNATRDQIRSNEVQLDSYKEKLARFDILAPLERKMKQVRRAIDSSVHAAAEFAEIGVMCDRVRAKEKQWSRKHKFLSMSPIVEDALLISKRRASLVKEIKDIQYSIIQGRLIADLISQKKKEQQSCELVGRCLTQFEKVQAAGRECQALSEVLTEYSEMEAVFVAYKQDVERLDDEYKSLWNSLGLCPLCGAKLQEEE